MDKILDKFEKDNFFQLKLKSIQITDNDILNKLSNKLDDLGYKNKIIDENNIYDDLYDAYINKVDYVLINEKIDILLPQLIVIIGDYCNLIKPIIPVYYYLKDNKIIQKLKTTCNSNYTTYTKIDKKDEIVDIILQKIMEGKNEKA